MGFDDDPLSPGDGGEDAAMDAVEGIDAVEWAPEGRDGEALDDGQDQGTDMDVDDGGASDMPDDVDESAEDVSDGEPVPCVGGQFECQPDGSARRCVDSMWTDVGRCLLGCDETNETCFYPSNVPASAAQIVLDPALVAIDAEGIASPVTIDGDTGEIEDGAGNTLRSAGEGIIGGVYFSVIAQADDPGVSAGLFAAASLAVPAGMTLVVVGSNPVIILVRGGVDIHGTFDAGARRDAAAVPADGDVVPGPGGAPGGRAGAAGSGACSGAADGGEDCAEYCTSGGGGGGFGGEGGDGGDGADPDMGCLTVFTGGAGGGTCGSSDLRPLVGGSGGGGGGAARGAPSVPGTGGAGGGAVQITSLAYIHVHDGGIVTSPGGGGGGGRSDGGGGGGGGSGGAILLESASVILDAGSVLASNGGGGGSGDCT